VITPYDFWYDRQQVRFLEQIIRAFSGFQYQTGSIAGAPPQTLMVPCRMATSNRMIANIMANASENTLQAVPLITVYQTGLRGRREDLQNPAFVDQLQVVERQVVDGVYTPLVGNSYSVDRIMPMPFTMEVNVDLWTSNMEQKYMLCEQMLAVCYPQFQIQNSDNALDWTAVSICFVDDEIIFSSQTIPVGDANSIDILTLKLRIPMWLSAPAAVTEISRIEEVVANVNAGELTLDTTLVIDPTVAATTTIAPGESLGRVLVTPQDYHIGVAGSIITLLDSRGSAIGRDGLAPQWQTFFDLYGKPFQPMISTIRLYSTTDIAGAFVSGTLQYGLTRSELIWSIDPSTLPANTLPAISGVINPLQTFPGNGLPDAVAGDRYLLLNDVGNSQAWNNTTGTFTAKANDIIEFDGTDWVVSINPSDLPMQYLLNHFTTTQLQWNGSDWAVALDGAYGPGLWRLLF
jgi:hypothetical protein